MYLNEAFAINYFCKINYLYGLNIIFNLQITNKIKKEIAFCYNNNSNLFIFMLLIGYFTY
ncbi:hypothetical protein GCM10022291_05230 [Postechiella marina]|uniref:Uncharacterized protein n=1 Tax=Postechiella marina TaxID=943941 RepID=A0ABP8C288_9FLAO